jgi:outer membrane lipoprotein SlyB
MKKLFSLSLIAMIGAMLSGCLVTSGNNRMGMGSYGSYAQHQSMQTQQARPGTVLQVRQVIVQEESGMGTYAATGGGAALGALAMSRVGKGNGRKVAQVVGALAGAGAGNALANVANQAPGQEVIVRLDDNQILSVVQPGSNLFPGQSVFLIGGGWSGARIVPRS